jgi:magnesium-transporting ATPase (P-type)
LFRTRISEIFNHLDKAETVLFLIFLVLASVLTLLTVIRKYSVIPILGVLFCAYLMIEIPADSWGYFFLWMTLGLAILPTDIVKASWQKVERAKPIVSKTF